MTQQQTDVEPIAERLAHELGELDRAANGGPVASFGMAALETYTLIAAIQAASRHPALSPVQLRIILGLAHQIADQVAGLARARFGEVSAIETTLAMGFDEQLDVPIGRERDPLAAHLDLEDLADVVADDVESPVLGQGRCRYVEPRVLLLPGEEGAELSRCGRCNRFFVEILPLRLFLGEGRDALGLEICENCAPGVVGRMETQRQAGGGARAD